MSRDRKYIAWLNGCSVAIGPTVAHVESAALELFRSERWQLTHAGKPTTLRITTYGSQRLVFEYPCVVAS